MKHLSLLAVSVLIVAPAFAGAPKIGYQAIHCFGTTVEDLNMEMGWDVDQNGRKSNMAISFQMAGTHDQVKVDKYRQLKKGGRVIGRAFEYDNGAGPGIIEIFDNEDSDYSKAKGKIKVLEQNRVLPLECAASFAE